MDDTFGGFLLGLMAGLVVATISYFVGKDSVQEQAVAAQAACYKADHQGKVKFRWGCKQD